MSAIIIALHTDDRSIDEIAFKRTLRDLSSVEYVYAQVVRGDKKLRTILLAEEEAIIEGRSVVQTVELNTFERNALRAAHRYINLYNKHYSALTQARDRATHALRTYVLTPAR